MFQLLNEFDERSISSKVIQIVVGGEKGDSRGGHRLRGHFVASSGLWMRAKVVAVR